MNLTRPLALLALLGIGLPGGAALTPGAALALGAELAPSAERSPGAAPSGGAALTTGGESRSVSASRSVSVSRSNREPGSVGEPRSVGEPPAAANEVGHKPAGGQLDHAPVAANAGNNPAAGAVAAVNGTELYYESYGTGAPLLLLHGNGGSIADLAPQISFFAPHFRVIALDSRDHGKSATATLRVTYEQMADDVRALLEHLELPRVRVLGISDGGIVGLLLALRAPERIERLAVMGANLDPSGAHPLALAWAKAQLAEAERRLAAGDRSRDWARERRHFDLLVHQPKLTPADLQKITAPTLVLSGDKDVIRLEHTVQLFEALPHAHLAILPGSTHFASASNPDVFNRTVDEFFRQPFTRPDTLDLIR